MICDNYHWGNYLWFVLNRQQLDSLYRLDSRELQDVINKEITREQNKHEQEYKLYKER